MTSGISSATIRFSAAVSGIGSSIFGFFSTWKLPIENNPTETERADARPNTILKIRLRMI